MKAHLRLAFLAASAASGIAVSGHAYSQTGTQGPRQALEEFVDRPSDPAALGRFKGTLPRLKLSIGPGHETNLFIADGDVALEEDAIVDYGKRLARPAPCIAYVRAAGRNEEAPELFAACKAALSIATGQTGSFNLTLPKNTLTDLHRSEQGRPIAQDAVNVLQIAKPELAGRPTPELLQSVPSDGLTMRFSEQRLRPLLGELGRTIRSILDIKELALNITPDSKRDFWAKDSRRLNYAILRSTFPNETSYTTVAGDLGLAALDWHNLCPRCNIKLEHLKFHDKIDTLSALDRVYQTDEQGGTEGLRFSVVHARRDSGGYIAFAFFPSAKRQQRFLWVFPRYFTMAPNVRRGVLRHEIGHILGYRHEHIRMSEKAGRCIFEHGRWVDLTPERDPRSVMHYFCEGDFGELTFSELDRQAHSALYGPEP